MPREVQRVPHAGTVATHRCDATARITNMKVRLATCLFVLLPALGRSSHAGELDLPAPYEPRQAVEGTIRIWGHGAYDKSQDLDRKSTRLNSSHSQISYAVFCLKKKKNNTTTLKNTH